MKVVLVMFKDGQRRDFPITAPRTVIGRATDCGLRVPLPMVSRKHAEISLTDDAVTVRDLGSSNGTYLSGKRVAEAAAKPGDTLMIGPAVFVVQINGNPADIKPSDAVAPAGAAIAAGSEDDEETQDLLEVGDDDFDIDEMFADLDDDEDDEPPAKPRKK